MRIDFDPNDIDEVAQVTRLLDIILDKAATGEVSQPAVTGANVREFLTTPVDEQAGVELDANGTPWIEAVHATTKSKKADGTWTKKRGTDDAVLEAAEADARAKIAGTPVAPEMPPVEVVEETMPPVEMTELVNLYSTKQAEGLITPEGFSALYAQYDTTPADLATNETARRQMFDHLNGLVGLPV